MPNNAAPQNPTVNQLDEFTDKQKKFPGTRLILLLIIAVILVGVTNLIVATVSSEPPYINTTSSYKWHALINTSITIFIAIPAASFVLSFLLSLIPYKKHSYTSKYFPFALLTMLAIQVILFFLLMFDN
jgi:hypothetical protein